MPWGRLVEAHLHIARHVLSPATLERLAARAGFTIHPAAGNGAASYADVLRYLEAVRQVVGTSAWVSAKLHVTHRMLELGLTPSLPRPARTWAAQAPEEKP